MNTLLTENIFVSVIALVSCERYSLSQCIINCHVIIYFPFRVHHDLMMMKLQVKSWKVAPKIKPFLVWNETRNTRQSAQTILRHMSAKYDSLNNIKLTIMVLIKGAASKLASDDCFPSNVRYILRNITYHSEVEKLLEQYPEVLKHLMVMLKVLTWKFMEQTVI